MASNHQNGHGVTSLKRKAAATPLPVDHSLKKAAALVPAGRVLLSAETDEEEAVRKAADNFVRNLIPPSTSWRQSSSFNSKNSPYPDVWGIPEAYRLFNLNGAGGLSSVSLDAARSTARIHLDTQKSRFLGYQCNLHLDIEKYAAHYLDTSLNNVGDPFTEGNSTVNTKFMERAVLDYYAALWRGKAPHQKDDLDSYWGFVLTMGSTEGNLYGMWNARDYLSGKKMLVNADGGTTRRVADGNRVNVPQFVYHSAPLSLSASENAYTPIAFYSEDTHYSISKTMVVLGIRTFYAEGSAKYDGQCPLAGMEGVWPEEVPSHDDGSIDVNSLELLVEFFASRGYPIIVNFNYGTTFKGAYDDVEGAATRLRPILQRYGLYERNVHWNEEKPEVYDVRTGFWFHVDGALGAAYMPYVEMAYDSPNGPLIDKKGPVFDFRLPMVHSIAMSGHKWIGASMPTGVYMTRTKYQMNPPEIPEYIGTPDTTFAGSRNGLSAMILWDNLARHSLSDQIRKSLHLLKLAGIAEQKLRHLQDNVLREDLWVERSHLSLTVHFKRINDTLCKKYSISNDIINGRPYSHIFLMEHVTEQLLDEFIEDLKKPGAFVETSSVASESALIRSVAEEKGLLAPASNRLQLLSTASRGFHC